MERAVCTDFSDASRPTLKTNGVEDMRLPYTIRTEATR
jgi:hypothetical protein